MTTVSLYIPCYNGEAFIAACIEGALSQTMPPDEILIIDDGSTDRSVELASAYPQVRVIRQETNKGLAVARNTALREAKGEFLAALDADCVAKPTWLQTLVTIMAASPDVSGCSGMLVENNHDAAADRFRALHIRQHWGDKQVICPSFLMGANTMFRKASLQAIGGYDEKFRTNGEDVNVCHRLYRNGGLLIYEPSAVAFHSRSDTIRSVLNMQWRHLRNPYCVYNPPDTIRKMLTMVGRQLSHAASHRLMPDLKERRYKLAVNSFLYLFYAVWKEVCAWWKLRGDERSGRLSAATAMP